MKLHSANLLRPILATALSIFASLGLAQSPSQTPTSAGLSGLVIKEPGSEPLKKALIELIAETQNAGGNYTATSGPDGSFHIEGISPGRYRLFVERTGYQETDKHHRPTEGRAITLSAGQEIKDLVIRLQATAVIEGRVTDEDGDPMPESQITIFRRTFVAGRTHWDQAGAERTNDLGEYRIANLPAGSYFISVAPPPDFKNLIETASTPSHNLPDQPVATAYQTSYYPGTRDRGQAAPVELHSGDDFPANFSLTPGPSLTIRGVVTNLPPNSTASISLQSKDFNVMLNGAEMHKDGSFEIRDVCPGAYTILATLENSPVPMMARQTLQLAESVDSIRLTPQPGATIHGRLQMETNSSTRLDPNQMFLLLRLSDTDDTVFDITSTGSSFSTLAHVNADGRFSWTDVPAGHYFVQFSDSSGLPDWFLKSVLAGGRDVADAGFSVNGGTAILELVASGQGAAVEGVVTNQKNEPFADATVVAVPEVGFRGHPDRYRKAVADQAGRFTLRGLHPGGYSVFAWESVEGEAYYDPEFLKIDEGKGKELRVSEGERVSVQLRVIPLAVEEQLQ